METNQATATGQAGKLANLTTEERNYLYNIGAKKCQAGDYKAAQSIFQLLVGLDGTNSLYAKSLASCYQVEENYFQAYILYNYAYLLDMANSNECLFFMGICLFEMEEYVRAQKKLEEFLPLATNKSQIGRAKLLLKVIQSKLENQ